MYGKLFEKSATHTAACNLNKLVSYISDLITRASVLLSSLFLSHDFFFGGGGREIGIAMIDLIWGDGL